MEISFTDGAGTIQPGGESGEIQPRIHAANWSNFDETNDYSYGATQTAFADWDHGTVYQQGKLVWGIEPQNLIVTNFIGTSKDMGLLGGIFPRFGVQNMRLWYMRTGTLEGND